MKRSEETKLRASLIEAIERWWDGEVMEATGATVPLVGDATLVFMADAALNVLLAIDDVQTYLRESGQMVE